MAVSKALSRTENLSAGKDQHLEDEETETPNVP